ncbi:dephospho-CoA kinase [Ornithinicoccus halotolerans]|uniref:dephospho-CoA kinase n=1 Tax=Ornithinicoccus halotolerans TaxID=1748220 RepID=UPI0012970156|nr:dephospho-CoA kinase [Ornithinicoccus halotolerans]
MLVVGLTGGIGSGKSSVAARFAEHGAHVLDADRIAREVVAPGSPGLQAVRERFGEEVVAGGTLDRAALGRIVFADPAARADLEAITHPLVGERTAAELARLPQGAWAVHDVPLLVELGYAPRYHLVVVVDAPEQVRVDRLVQARGMAAADAWSRLRAQASGQQRRAVADVWLDNSGARQELDAQVARLVTERLEPLRRRLRQQAAVAEGEALPPPEGEDVPGRAARVRHRLDHVLAQAGYRPGAAELATDAAGWTRGTLRLAGAAGEAGLHQSLAEAGFPAAALGSLGSADPGRPVMVGLTGV